MLDKVFQFPLIFPHTLFVFISDFYSYTFIFFFISDPYPYSLVYFPYRTISIYVSIIEEQHGYGMSYILSVSNSLAPYTKRSYDLTQVIEIFYILK